MSQATAKQSAVLHESRWLFATGNGFHGTESAEIQASVHQAV